MTFQFKKGAEKDGDQTGAEKTEDSGDKAKQVVTVVFMTASPGIQAVKFVERGGRSLAETLSRNNPWAKEGEFRGRPVLHVGVEDG